MHFTNLYSVVLYPILCRLVFPAPAAAVRPAAVQPLWISFEVNFASGSRDFRCSFAREQRKTATEQRGVLLFFARRSGRGSRISAEHDASLTDNPWKNSENMDCTPWVRQENGDRLTGLDCAGMKLGRRLTWPAKRKRALLGSNPPRNSRPETHGDAADAGGWCLPASLLMGWVGHWASP